MSNDQIIQKIKNFILLKSVDQKEHLLYLQRFNAPTSGAQCLALGYLEACEVILDCIAELEINL